MFAQTIQKISCCVHKRFVLSSVYDVFNAYTINNEQCAFITWCEWLLILNFFYVKLENASFILRNESIAKVVTFVDNWLGNLSNVDNSLQIRFAPLCSRTAVFVLKIRSLLFWTHAHSIVSVLGYLFVHSPIYKILSRSQNRLWFFSWTFPSLLLWKFALI